MWTERLKYLNNIDEIKDYLDNENNFHDYIIGDFFYDGKSASIHIEEAPIKKDISNEKGLIYDFKLENVTSFYINNDCFFKFFNKDCYVENNELIFELDQGIIKIKADRITLGIPSPIRPETTIFESLEITVSSLMLDKTIMIQKNHDVLEIDIDDRKKNRHIRMNSIQLCYAIEELDIYNWKDDYMNNHCLDGVQWSIEYKERGKNIKIINGSNDYPDDWDKLLGMLMDIHPKIKEMLKSYFD